MRHVSKVYVNKFMGEYVTLEQELDYIHRRLDSVNHKLALLLDHLRLTFKERSASIEEMDDGS